MSKEECLTANWLDRGYRDGREGYPLSRLQDHYKACQEVGVVPEERAYRKGHSEGIYEYCRPERALIEGREGRMYRNACPAQLEREFLHYYRAGKRVYEAEYYVGRLSSEQQQLETQLRKEKDAGKRKQLRREIRDLDHQLREARRHLIREEKNLPSPYLTY